MYGISIKDSLSYYHIHVLLLLLFLYGYFQQSNNVSSKTVEPVNLEDYSNYITITNDLLEPKYDRLIFVVIDALRYDFVTKSLMPYTYEAAVSNDCFFQVKVSAPTVTLPRIKTLTTGMVPQYFDMVMNLWVSEAESSAGNSFLHIAKESGKKLLFYGDDTWLHLYPKIFDRSEGINSMFVNDFYEVDDNVTRNVRMELLRTDWDFMFLHYLGLDHIGHVEGPNSRLIPPKLMEMDAFVRLVREQSHGNKTLVVVTGDHGMRDTGGHGGTSHAETHVPLALLGHKCYKASDDVGDPNSSNSTKSILSRIHRDNIRQSDIPTSLALLFGLAIPPDSVGRFIPDFYSELTMNQRFYYCLRNQKTLLGQLTASRNSSLTWNVLRDCEMKLISVTDERNATDSTEHVLLLICCVLVQLTIGFKSVQAIVENSRLRLKFYDFFVVLYFFVYKFVPFEMSIVLLSVVALYTLTQPIPWYIFVTKKLYPLNYYLTFLTIFSHSLLLFCSTSFIEEEHQIWYALFVTAVLLVFYNNQRSCIHFEISDIVILIVFRFIKCLNQTGDQFASTPDIIDWFLLPENYVYSLVFMISSYIFLAAVCHQYFKRRKVYFVFNCLLLGILVYKLFYALSIYYAQTLWLSIFFLSLLNYFNGMKNIDIFLIFWVCVSILVCRPHNVMMVPFTIMMSSYFSRNISKNNVYQIILHIVLGSTVYFCSGFSNSLASVDVAAGYTGISSYSPVLVTIIILCNTYSLPILSQILLLKNSAFSFRQILSVYIIDRIFTLVLICGIMVIQCEHLFVWTVFAPKLLIEACHSIILWIELVLYQFFT